MDGKAFLAYLLKSQYFSSEQLHQCLKESAQTHIPILKLLVQNNLISSENLKLALEAFKKNEFKTILLSPEKQGINQDETSQLTPFDDVKTLPSIQNIGKSLPAVQKFGKYQIIEEIARGGMGIVYKAKHIELGQIYALKIILASHFASEEDIKRFYREAKLTAKLKHPNIVQVVDSGEEAGQHYLAMEFIEGKDLKQLIQEKKLSIRKMLSLFRKILAGLSIAHENGIIHRDLKPANIFVTTEGEPKIGDFGLAKESALSKESHQLTKTGNILGTPAYMPPEQACGENKLLDARADIYAIGVCLYEALTQRCPFEGKTLHELFYKITSEEPIRPSQYNKKVHHDLDTIVLKTLEKEKERRYASAEAFEEDLERFLEGYPILAKPLSRREYFYKWLKRNRKVALVVLVTFLLSIGGSIYWQHLRYQKTLKKHQERLGYWKTQLKRSQVVPRIRENALFEIAKMQAEEICDELLLILEEGKQYFINKTEASPKQGKYYQTMVDALGRLENPKAVPFIKKALEQFSDRALQKSYSSSAAELHFFVSLADALANIQQKKAIPFLEKIRSKMGKDSQFCRQTDWTYRNLLNQEQLNSSALSSAQEYYERGLKKTEKGDIKGSLLDYNQAIQLNPQMSEAYEARASMKYVQKDLNGAIADYTQATTLNPKNAKAYLKCGFIKQLKGEFKEAVLDFNQAIKLNPKNEVAYNNRANVKLAQKDLDGAISDYTKAITLDPQYAEAYHNRGTIKEMKGDIKGALLDYNQSIKFNPQLSNSYAERGNLKRVQNDLDGAISDYKQAINLDPHVASFYTNLGKAKKLKGDLKGAFLDFNQAIKLDPQTHEAYANRGDVKREQKDLDGAIADYTQAIALKPKYAEVYHNRGSVKKRKGNLKGALLDFNKAIQLNPKMFETYFNRGDIKLTQKDLMGAISDLSQAITLNPQFINSYTNRGKAKKLKGDLKGALLDYDQAIKLNPKLLEAYFNRGNIKLTQKDFDGAISDFTKAIALNPKYATLYGNRGHCFLQKGDPLEKEKAFQDFKHFLELTKEDDSPRMQQFRAYIFKHFPTLKSTLKK